MSYRGRFAPSPTGDLHLGSAATALIAWLRARAAGGALILRVEDIDTPRVIPGCEAQQLTDLRWMGLDWDEGPDVGGPHAPYRQSERRTLYEAAIRTLASQGLVYLCDCSRRELLATAPPSDQRERSMEETPGAARMRLTSAELLPASQVLATAPPSDQRERSIEETPGAARMRLTSAELLPASQVLATAPPSDQRERSVEETPGAARMSHTSAELLPASRVLATAPPSDQRERSIEETPGAALEETPGAALASAPHAGEEGPRYPGTCRPLGMRARRWKRPPAVRVALPDREVVVNDVFQGVVRQDVAQVVGDFVLKRGDGVYAYQLAVVVDDLAMGITEVVRGADLLSSAPRQALLAEMLGGRAPGFAHVPLILGADGARLAKRNPRHTVQGLRALGMSPAAFVAGFARGLGIDPSAVSPALTRAASESFDLSALRGRREFRLPL